MKPSKLFANLQVVGSISSIPPTATGVAQGSNVVMFSNASGQTMIMDSLGRVGIGTKAPVYSLDVTGDVRANTYYGDGGFLSNIVSFIQPIANLVVSNSVTTTNVHVTNTLDVLGSMTANAANATFFFDTFTIPYINTQYMNVASTLTAPLANIVTMNVGYLTVNSAVVYGTSTLNVYGVSNLTNVYATKYYGDGSSLSGLISFIGATGATGTAGTNGATGATGTAGTNGATGATGATGFTGATGASGYVGVDGATGATGTAGTNGATGATGTAGTNGATGATGAAGNSGATGPAPTGGIGSMIYLSSSGVAAATSNTELVWDNTNKRFGIAATPSTYTLQVGGTIGCSGDITALYSDERLKTKTGTLTHALDKVCSIDTFTYLPNDTARRYGFNDSIQRVGVSAQQVQKVLPEAVRPAPFDVENKTGHNYLTVQYEKIVPLLIESIKELRDRLERLEKQT